MNTKKVHTEGQARSAIADKLLRWYDEFGRDLLWRRDISPYRVWVSEIMLQQTRVEAVESYFERFLNRFPDMAALAAASEQDVLQVWQGLGYYSRARNLQAGVREVLERYGGELPDTRAEVEALTGVGSYTAGALLSIVHGKAEAAVDGNVLRVFSRLFCMELPITSSAGKRAVTTYVQAVIPQDRPGDFNQAIMDLGASHCGRTPQCRKCPLQSECEAYRRNWQNLLPIRTKKTEPIPVSIQVGVISSGERFFVRKRPAKGLLANMWEFPTVETKEAGDQSALCGVFADCGQTIEPLLPWRQLKHVFSHRVWEMQIFRANGQGETCRNPEGGCWMTLKELDSLPLGKPHRTIADWLCEAALLRREDVSNKRHGL